jgi:transcriptional regulator with XRE-family HTH domain
MTEPMQSSAAPAPGPRQEKLPLSWQDDNGPAEAPAQPTVDRTPATPAPAAPLPAPAPVKAPVRRPAGPVLTPPAVPQSPVAVSAAAAARPEPAAASLQRPLKFGRVLHDAREKRNLSTAEVSQRTKIPKEFVENAETGQVESLPPPVYCKSYLRQLCKEYGLDASAMLEEYRKAIAGGDADSERENPPFVVTSKQAETGAKVGYQPRSPNEDGENMQKMSPTTILVCAVLIGLLVLAVIVFAMNRRHGGATGATATTSAQVAPGEKLNLESFITPQQIPLKELPVPNP